MLIAYGHKSSILAAKNIIENKLNKNSKQMRLNQDENGTSYDISGYPKYMTNLIIRLLIRHPHTKYTDEIIGKSRYFTLYTKNQ
jgi:hypothetical protein